MLATFINLSLYGLVAVTFALITWKTLDLWFGASVLRRPTLAHGLEGLSGDEARRRLAERIEWLERGLPALATIASMAPFVGLGGTVLHIMEALTRLSGAGADLLVISGPIAVALKATLLGLVAAVPAGVAYNLMLRRLQLVENRAMRELARVGAP